MKRNERTVLLIIALLLLVGFFLWRFLPGHAPVTPPSEAELPPVSTGAVVIVSSAPAVSSSTVMAPKVPEPAKPKTKAPARQGPAQLPAAANGSPKPPDLKLHTELIPKDITIVRCYYQQEINPPGSTFGFDINGSGFNEQFQQMIKVESGVPHVLVKNLRLVTANQIHGDMVVSPEAKTGFVYPRVLIKGLPVFSAPEPFAVIRKGEVLNIIFISMEETGRAGRFRIFTHLDDPLYKKFTIVPSTAGLDIADLEPHLPYVVEGTLRIGARVPTGEYGLTVKLGDKTIFQRLGMIRIVRPNIGQSGFVQGLTATEPYRRPGDAVDLYVLGSGFSPQDVNDLQAKVGEFDMGKSSFTFINGTQLRLRFASPKSTPPGSYSVTVSGPGNQVLYEKKDAIRMVPANWIAGVQVAPPVSPGGKSTLRIIGRDFSPDYASRIQIELDEPGITLSPLQRVDANGLAAEITVGPKVAPGDYWIQMKADGRKIDPPYGSIIKVQPGTN